MAWTETTRPYYARNGPGYASDATDGEWALIQPLMPKAKRLGRRRKVKLRRVVDAIFYRWCPRQWCSFRRRGWRAVEAVGRNGASTPAPGGHRRSPV